MNEKQYGKKESEIPMNSHLGEEAKNVHSNWMWSRFRKFIHIVNDFDDKQKSIFFLFSINERLITWQMKMAMWACYHHPTETDRPQQKCDTIKHALS